MVVGAGRPGPIDPVPATRCSSSRKMPSVDRAERRLARNRAAVHPKVVLRRRLVAIHLLRSIADATNIDGVFLELERHQGDPAPGWTPEPAAEMALLLVDRRELAGLRRDRPMRSGWPAQHIGNGKIRASTDGTIQTIADSLFIDCSADGSAEEDPRLCSLGPGHAPVGGSCASRPSRGTDRPPGIDGRQRRRRPTDRHGRPLPDSSTIYPRPCLPRPGHIQLQPYLPSGRAAAALPRATTGTTPYLLGSASWPCCSAGPSPP